jgi:hypothetical protein
LIAEDNWSIFFKLLRILSFTYLLVWSTEQRLPPKTKYRIQNKIINKVIIYLSILNLVVMSIES